MLHHGLARSSGAASTIPEFGYPATYAQTRATAPLPPTTDAYGYANARHAADPSYYMYQQGQQPYVQAQPDVGHTGLMHPQGGLYLQNADWNTQALAPSLHLSHSRQQLVQQQAFFDRQQQQQRYRNDHSQAYPAVAEADFWLSQPAAENGGYVAQSGKIADFHQGARDMAEAWDGVENQEFHDHPSFAKPPHRQSRASSADPPRVQAPSGSQHADTDSTHRRRKSSIENIQLIPENASSIPPPPPLEKSAYPLALLATELVWEAFLAAASSNSGSGSSSPLTSMSSGSSGSPHRSRFEDRHGLSPSSPQTPFSRRNQGRKSISPKNTKRHERTRSASGGVEGPAARGFGAIGGERRPKVGTSSPDSEMSSPASSTPGTPNMDGNAWTVHTNDSHPALSRFGWDREHMEEQHVDFYNGKQHQLTLPPISSWARSSNNSPLHYQQQASYGFAAATMPSPAPPAALFDQIQKLLGATLLSQQVLLLALYFVVKIPHTSPLYPPATSQSALQSTSAPFKLLLAALVVANKHLDDNSFRNSTFATVANVALPEVNALEYSLLNALHFDVNVATETWMTWLRDLDTQQATISSESSFTTCAHIRAVIDGVIGQQYEQDLARHQQRHATSLSASPSMVSSPLMDVRARKLSMDMPLTPLTPRSDATSGNGSFDLDAAGPLEMRPRYKASTAGAYDAYNYVPDNRPYYNSYHGPCPINSYGHGQIMVA